MAFLIHRAVGDQLQLSSVEGDLLRIGRATGAELRLKDAAVALDHAVIRADAAGWSIEDRGSITGTYLQGRPIQSARLGEDSIIEIGSFRLRAQITHPEDPLFLHVSPAEASPLGPSTDPITSTGPISSMQAPPVDYSAAYALSRPWFTKGTITLACTATALLAICAVLATGALRTFMPGISSAHAGLVHRPRDRPPDSGSEPRRQAARGCFACHRPWRSPQDAACSSCHSTQGLPHTEILATASAEVLSCAGCHPEHRGKELRQPDEASTCLPCHENLGKVVSTAVSVVNTVTSFATNHPELTVTVETAAGSKRFALDDPAAASADPATLDFNHHRHRVQERDEEGTQSIRGPNGPVTLLCSDCHQPARLSGLMEPLRFETHCQSCHQLGFDAGFPDRQAPHGPAQEVANFLLAFYSENSGGGARPGSSLREYRLNLIRRGERGKLPGGVRRQAAEASRNLFRSTCDVCHAVDLEAVPVPAIAPTRLQERWFADGGFSHLDHPAVACAECHGNAPDSRRSSDLLLSGIATCRRCHGEDNQVAPWSGRLSCSQCHDYHRAT